MDLRDSDDDGGGSVMVCVVVVMLAGSLMMMVVMMKFGAADCFGSDCENGDGDCACEGAAVKKTS